MADHAELIKEMGEIEKLSSQERLKRAKKRRQSQVCWSGATNEGLSL